ncbi:stage III sporulation protein AA [Sinanaerobacter chloroacetimidivorans]|jgi:stage III sporulation protein AA|uniref:Stage III sporulation protein AA n=1 Tax=Sinanaerobacter chloroacetimidivorans TaxID=2818044 RepID=A0A8J7VZY8_9FIRM|nr:stage III sporulation protein AA [Sinanaerobacter chloroacetimidivorans]MBR0596641.1 stage III sporulation protein AA [Sinanaerobacter chloroacetimidivorans]
MNGLENILTKLPADIGEQLKRLPDHVLNNLEEIRIRTGNQVMILAGGREYELQSRIGKKMDKETLNMVFNTILNHSAYAYQEELSNGYITIEGGHRVGICGRTVMENGRVKTIKDISSVNIRRSREIIGVSDPCMRYIMKGNDQIYNTIIVSPPKCGKTTLLRDMIRNLSGMGHKVGVCDERSEISGTYHGQASYDLGIRTDVLDGCPKEKGMIMLIRSMAPDIIATDEIGKKEDCYAIEAAVCAGIKLLTTIHGSTYEDLISSGIGEMVLSGVFERLIFLSNIPATGSIAGIRDWRNISMI